MLAPSHSAAASFSEFYTGGNKRGVQENVDARNMLANAFLGRSAPVNQPPQQFHYHPYNNVPSYYYDDYYPRSRSRSSSRRPRRYSDSSDYSTPEKRRKRTRRHYKSDDKNDDPLDKNSIVNID